MLNKIEKWIDETIINFEKERISCGGLIKLFEGFYPPEFLSGSYYVVVDSVPKPNFPELHQQGLGGFIEMDVDGITYKNTYFIRRGLEENLALHFHELVHVLQWKYLGAQGLISRYIQEVKTLGYIGSPLELMAYGLQDYYQKSGVPFDVPRYVRQKI